IATRAHTTVVVEMPMTGDAVQTMKAGILEIGDVYVVNKADLGNEDVLVANLKFQLTARDGWIPSVIRTAATEGRGIDELADALDRHAAYLDQTGFRAKREVARARLEILENAQRLLSRRVANRSRMGRAFDALAEEVAARRLDPHAAARKLLWPTQPREKRTSTA
ncbi:MAG: methylmalonyl Co-A mutase-associated GTPase MeaB, partial [Methanobacteriota archaeon]